MVKKIHGLTIHNRGSNHKYSQLDDLDALYELLTVKCIADVAKDLGVPPNSINYRVKRYFSRDWIEKIVKKRRV